HIDAADLLQELQLILWSGFVRGTYEPATPSHFLALAKTILLGCVSRHWRAVKAMTITVKQRLDVIIADSPVPVRRDQGEPVSTVDFADSARRILDQLDRVDRRLVEMRLQGHSTAEAARELGVDAGCLRVRLRRLRQRLCDKGLVEQPIASSS